MGAKSPPCAWPWEGLGKMEALPTTGFQRSPDCWGDARKWEGIFLTGMEDELPTQGRLALSVPCSLSPLVYRCLYPGYTRQSRLVCA